MRHLTSCDTAVKTVVSVALTALSLSVAPSHAAPRQAPDTTMAMAAGTDPRMAADTAGIATDTMDLTAMEEAEEMPPTDGRGLRATLKSKFIEGNASFMSLVAMALVLGLAFCIERILYLSLSEINAKKFMAQVDSLIEQGDIDAALTLCRDTRGPVASICYQGLLRMDTDIEDIERSMAAYGAVQSAQLSKGCSWITLFIAIAPSLGFLGTVIGMVMAFEQIQMAGDINPTVVAAGMKVALITTIFGIIVALILQIFYNYVISKIDHLNSQMEESAIALLDAILKYKTSHP